MNVTSATSSLRTTRPVLADVPATTTSSMPSSSGRVDNFVGVPVSEGERNRKVVDDFYNAFERKDGAGMSAAYAPNAKFSDPVFPKLENSKGAAMWRMLCKSDEPAGPCVPTATVEILIPSWIKPRTAPSSCFCTVTMFTSGT